MAFQKNTYKVPKTDKNSNKKTKGKLKGKKIEFQFVSKILLFFTDERLHRTIGLFMLFFSVYLFVAFLSHFYTWQKNYLISELPIIQLFTDNSIQIYNITGKIGARFSYLLINKWFGISSFLFPFVFFILGIKLFLKISIIPINRTLKQSLFGLIWGSVFFGFFFSNIDLLVGYFGHHSVLIISGLIGKVGTGFLLLFSIICFLIFAYDIPIAEFLKNTLINFKEKNKSEDDVSVEKEPTIDEGIDIENQNTSNEVKKEELKFDLDIEADDEEKNTNYENKQLDLEIDVKTDDSEIINIEKNELNTEEKEEDKEEELELTVENEESLEGEEEVDDEHRTIDTLYDPTLDLPHYTYPTLDLLIDYGNDSININEEELEANKNDIVRTLENFSIKIEKIKATIGPTVTLYELVPAPGIRISKIKNLEDDIALSLSALGIRIIAPIPGKGTIGIEVPNRNPKIVPMKNILASETFSNSKYDLPIALGKTISNETYVADLAKMPHLLMAGATGQGKSVGLNAILASLLYKKHPSQIKFILVDPKKVELALFSKIERHFLAKLPDSEESIITDTRKVVRTLNSLCIEMDNRYNLLKDAEVRNIKEYNAKFIKRKLNPNNGHRFLPYIVLVVDEFADLIMTAGKEVEAPIARIAQLARAIGIHLIIATQRPSVNIITGTIKANFPARIAFRVTAKVDSRTILDAGGADQLVGRGDMLLATGSSMIRLQCAFIDTPEVEEIATFIGSQQGYADAFMLPEFDDETSEGNTDLEDMDRDVLFEDAARLVVQNQQGSTSLIQRKLKLGYNRAGRIIDQLEAAGIVGHFEGSKAREVKIKDEMSLEQILQLGTKE